MKNTILAGTLAAMLAGCSACPVNDFPAKEAAIESSPQRGTGDLGIVIERTGSVLIVENSGDTVLGRVENMGDLSHAAAVFSRDQKYAYVFGRDGAVTKVDLLTQKIDKRVVQAGNSIGGAISADGRIVAAQNYAPGGVKFFDADTLELLSEVSTLDEKTGKASKVVGLADFPGNRFIFSLFEAGEIWEADVSDPRKPIVTKHKQIGKQPYDGLGGGNGRYYIAGLFGEDGLAMLDLWKPTPKVQRILGGYAHDQNTVPIYKMPHLRGWSISDGKAFLPAIGLSQVLVADVRNWQQTDRISVAGQPVFVMASPDARQVWVNFAFPDNGKVQVIDVPSMKVVHSMEPCKGVLHFEFAPRSEEVWLSCRDDHKVQVYDTQTFRLKAELKADSPSGIFFTNRAARIGM
ncbi:Heme D1 biosynthesis protein, potentially involved in cofactor synthesis for nitrite reductase [gamma proteobacterium HdN1]|nr:Heme D1 biosynthesis protein, potentially involved in cofactor synthesis for nitrite reductase [gamma proteobacterium HdN1]